MGKIERGKVKVNLSKTSTCNVILKKPGLSLDSIINKHLAPLTRCNVLAPLQGAEVVISHEQVTFVHSWNEHAQIQMSYRITSTNSNQSHSSVLIGQYRVRKPETSPLNLPLTMDLGLGLINSQVNVKLIGMLAISSLFVLPRPGQHLWRPQSIPLLAYRWQRSEY